MNILLFYCHVLVFIYYFIKFSGTPNIAEALVGDTPATAATSCNQIMKDMISKNISRSSGIYFVKDPSQNIVPAFCNFALFPRRGNLFIIYNLFLFINY